MGKGVKAGIPPFPESFEAETRPGDRSDSEKENLKPEDAAAAPTQAPHHGADDSPHEGEAPSLPRYKPPSLRGAQPLASTRPVARPAGRAKIIPCDKAPLLTRPDQFQVWRSRFLNYCFSIDPLYRRILEQKAVGNEGHEEQLYNALSYAVGDVREAHKIVTVLDDTDLPNKGTTAWRYLRQHYDRISESKVQRLLDVHRRPQGKHESLASYLQRYQIQHEELRQLQHPHTERTTTTSMIDGLKPEFREIKQYFRIHKKELDDLAEVVETCLELSDCYSREE